MATSVLVAAVLVAAVLAAAVLAAAVLPHLCNPILAFLRNSYPGKLVLVLELGDGAVPMGFHCSRIIKINPGSMGPIHLHRHWTRARIVNSFSIRAARGLLTQGTFGG